MHLSDQESISSKICNKSSLISDNSPFWIGHKRSVMTCASFFTSDLGELDLGGASVLGISKGAALIVGGKFYLSIF